MLPEQRTDADKLHQAQQFVAAHPRGCLMQSPRWALVKPNWGHHLLLSHAPDGRLRGSMLVLTLADRGDGSALLYAPRGPVCDPEDHCAVKELIEGARTLAVGFSHGEFKCDPLIEEGESGAIASLTSAGLRFVPGAAFGQTSQPRQNAVRGDLAGLDELAAESLDAQALGVRVATVAGGAKTLLVCHGGASFSAGGALGTGGVQNAAPAVT